VLYLLSYWDIRLLPKRLQKYTFFQYPSPFFLLFFNINIKY